MAASGTEARIAEALLAKLDALTLSPALRVAHPGRSFSPVTGETYLRASFITLPTQQPGLAHSSAKRYGGMLQVSIFAPNDDTGMIGTANIAGQVITHFARGTRMDSTTGSPATVVLTVEIGPMPPTMNSPMQESAWWHQPISIPFFANV